jgi:hypothetical protein
MGFLKKIGIILGVIFAVIIGIGFTAVYFILSNSNTTEVSESTQVSQLFKEKGVDFSESETATSADKRMQAESSKRIQEIVRSCEAEASPYVYMTYDRYVPIDCLIKKAGSVNDCKAYKDVIVAERTTIDARGDVKTTTRYFIEVDACIINYSWQFDDQKACKQAEDWLTCFGKVSEKFGPEICKVIREHQEFLDCIKTYLTHSYGANLSSYVRNLRAVEAELAAEQTYKSCIDVGLGNFGIKQNACKLESLRLEQFATEELLSWKSNDSLVACLPLKFPEHVNAHEYCSASLGVYRKNLSICDQSGTGRAECYGLLAITNDMVNLNTCDNLDKGISFCYMAVAYRLNDPHICLMDKAIDNRDNCLYMLAYKLKDATICDKMVDEARRHNCIAGLT